jgi:hypothetical protein
MERHGGSGRKGRMWRHVRADEDEHPDQATQVALWPACACTFPSRKNHLSSNGATQDELCQGNRLGFTQAIVHDDGLGGLLSRGTEWIALTRRSCEPPHPSFAHEPDQAHAFSTMHCQNLPSAEPIEAHQALTRLEARLKERAGMLLLSPGPLKPTTGGSCACMVNCSSPFFLRCNDARVGKLER